MRRFRAEAKWCRLAAMLTLYHDWDSFCSFKVRLCLEEKGLAWTGQRIDLMRFENLRPDYLALNAAGVVPTLVHDGAVVTESTIINEYLDDAFPAAPMRPADAMARARMRLWVRHEEEALFLAVRPASLNLMMKPVLGRYTNDELDALLAHHPLPSRVAFLKQVFHAPFDTAAVEKTRRKLAAALARMNETLIETPWLAGATYSLADIAAAPVVERILRLGMDDLWQDLPGVADWAARLRLRPAYGRARPPIEYRLPAVQPAVSSK
jgi:glutathione S-transferase